MKTAKLLAILMSESSILIANIGPQGFVAHPNRYFVETGSYCGNGIYRALQDGFPEIHSLELDSGHVINTRKRFEGFSNVHVYHEDSGKNLFAVIKNLDAQITFWLDAHNGSDEPINGKNTPLIAELDQIKQHHIKTHTLMIDDLHCCNTALFDYMSVDDIIQKVLEINSDYKITFEPGGDLGEYPRNVLVASPPDIQNTKDTHL